MISVITAEPVNKKVRIIPMVFEIKRRERNNEKLLNTVVPVLIEGVSEKNSDLCSGYTDTMKLVNVENAKDKIGQIISVKITDAKSFSLDGIAN